MWIIAGINAWFSGSAHSHPNKSSARNVTLCKTSLTRMRAKECTDNKELHIIYFRVLYVNQYGTA